jgi:hypothetical protein
LAPEIKRSLSSRIYFAHRRLVHILDSFWFYVTSHFSHTASPTEKEELPPHTQHREMQGRTPEKQSTFARSHRLLLECLGLPLAALTIVGFYLNYSPKLSVGLSGSLEDANPIASVFVLSNEGLLPVHDVLVKCGEIRVKSATFSWNSGPDSGFIFPWSRASKCLLDIQ